MTSLLDRGTVETVLRRRLREFTYDLLNDYWTDKADAELDVLITQCMDVIIPDIESMSEEFETFLTLHLDVELN